MARNLSFSYSKMGMYKECPMKYKFRYIHMIPEQPKYYFAFGSALHKVMEYIYNPANPAFPALEQTLAMFEKDWNSTSFDQKGYASMEKEMAGFAEGQRIIRSYYDKHQATFAHPLSVEMRSTLETDGLNLISILDRIDYLGDGKVQILDYKTGKTVERAPDQLFMYQKVVETSPAIKSLVQTADPSVKEVKVEKLCFYHLPSLKEMYFERAGDKEIFEFWQNVLKVADDIRAAKFTPTPGENQCRWCDYRNICPVFTGKDYNGPTGYAARNSSVSPAPQAAAVAAAEETKSDLDILADKIDRCGSLCDECARLKKEILDAMEQRHFERHFGKTYQAELVKSSKKTFADKQKTVDLLKKLNLLKKTLVPTQCTVEALLTDPSVPQEQKDQIQALVSETTCAELKLEKTE